MTASLSAGVDVGGTKCLGVVIDRAGLVVAEHRVATPRTGDSLVAALAEVAGVLRSQCPTVATVGVGVPGLVDGRGVLRFAPNLPGVTELAVAERLGRELNLSVYAENDATCALWAEATMGAAAGIGDVLFAALGTGIGGGFMIGGRLARGANGFAGEIGHTVVDPNGPLCPCGQRGCWERYASGSGLGWMGREAAQAGRAGVVVGLAGGDPEAVRGEHVTRAAAGGDAEATAVMTRFAWWVALGLSNLANVVDPACIVIGGGMVEAGDVLMDPTRVAFAQLVEGVAHRPEIPVRAAILGQRAGAIGAALLARAPA